MTTLGFANDFVQLPADSSGKKSGYYRFDTGGSNYLYLGAGVIVGATGIIADVSAAGLKVDLGADNDVTVTGNVAVTHAGLTALNGAIAGTEVQVDVLTMPSTAITNAGITTIAGAVAGTEMQVDVVAALPAGNNNIGDVDVASLPALPAGNNNIGDVDVASLPALAAGNANIGDVDIASVAAGVTIEATGDVASDQPIAANPVTVGGRASNAAPTEVSTDGDAVNLWLTRRGTVMVAALDHAGLDGAPYTLTSKTVQVTTAQTGSDVWTPAAGKKIVITYYQIQAFSTTVGTCILWFGANADTTYTRGTDLAIFDGEFAPSATLKPGIAMTGLWIASAVDHEVHLTSVGDIDLTVTLWGYEI